MKHVISMQVEDKAGTLSRIANLFAGRGYNIESLTVNETETSGVSNMTIVTWGDDTVIEQIIKQLRKLVNVLKVRDITHSDEHIERELALIKIHLNAKQRIEVICMLDSFRARMLDIAHDSAVIEVTGSESKVNAFIELVRPYGITEIIKTGVLAVAKGGRKTIESLNAKKGDTE